MKRKLVILLKKSKQKEFMEAEIAEIKKYKWILSEKYGRDLGVNAEIEWINKYAKLFREHWESIHGAVIDGMCNSGCTG